MENVITETVENTQPETKHDNSAQWKMREDIEKEIQPLLDARRNKWND